MMRPELLAPAGDLEKVKIALLYGADAVYIGGRTFSLRARASKFGVTDIFEAVNFAHKLKKKIYVTCNIVPHSEDLKELDDYLLDLERIKVDAIIVSNPYVLKRAQELTDLEIHISTQQSVTNSIECVYWFSEGAKRIVLARELSLEEIAIIKKKTHAELEIFIHGGMCVSYSGRCTLSNVMSLRDANRGGCAHSCRWEYDLFKNHELVASDFQMASRDLAAIEYVPRLIDIGVDSLKIEGRMKSIHYIATIVHTYRKLIDDYLSGNLQSQETYENEIKKAENRPTGPGFLNSAASEERQLYQVNQFPHVKEFCGVVISYDRLSKKALIEQRNFFAINDTIEIFSPDQEERHFKIASILSENGEELDAARHPLQKILIDSDITLKPYDLLRRVIE